MVLPRCSLRSAVAVAGTAQTIVGIGLIVAGLRRASSALQIAGFALFGVALAKLFLFDLAFLSSIARAFSFLAVGAVLLLGGFFVQRARVDSAS